MNKGLYAGSFDPMTCGHMDLIKRAAKICDELTIGIIENPSKQPMFTTDERQDMIRKACKDIPNLKVDSFCGLLADYVNTNQFTLVFRGQIGRASCRERV